MTGQQQLHTANMTVSGMPTELNIISYNCWGLKFISKNRKERMTEIGRRLAIVRPAPDIVGLQECWTQEDYKSIREQVRHVLPYGKFYYSGIFGGGLAILSRFPIEESSMTPYRLNGRPSAFFRGDWYVGKGVASAKIRIGPGIKDVVEVFTTHLHAPYEKEPNDSYLCHRTAQAWDIAKILRGAADRGHLALALGDFNMVPLSLAHKLLTHHSPVRDTWRELHPDSSIGAAVDKAERQRARSIPTAAFNLVENGTTCDSVLNTWRWSEEEKKRLGPGKPLVEVSSDKDDPEGRRLDYIFAGDGMRYGESGSWSVKAARVGFTERHPILKCSLSDHFSVEATLQWAADSQKYREDVKIQHLAVESEAYLDSPTLSEDEARQEDVDGGRGRRQSEAADMFGLQKVNTSVQYLPVETYDEILEMIRQYTSRERSQRRWRLGHFVASLFISIGCLIAVWWSPRNFVSFILMLISTLGLSAGVIDGLIGGLFVGSEIRSLKEFEWEIKNARRAAGGDELPDEHIVVDW